MDLREMSGRRKVPQLLAVPAGVTRTVGIKPHLFWDKTAYALGRTAGDPPPGVEVLVDEAAFAEPAARAA
jgi:hypothetical protein